MIELVAQLLVETTIPGTPRPKKRPRAKPGQRAYTPRATTDAEDYVRIHLRAAGVRGEPVTTDVAVELGFYLPDRRRVDIDNLEKLVLDACNGFVWKDDSQVIWKLTKVVRGSPEPRTELRISLPFCGASSWRHDGYAICRANLGHEEGQHEWEVQ